MSKIFAILTLLSISFGLTGCVGIGGEQISLAHNQLNPPEQQFSDALLMQKSANDLREEQDRIGRATITVFAITSGSVKTSSDVKQQITEQVKQALESIGYQVNLIDQSDAISNSAIVKIEIKKFWFKNYNWIWPFVPTWGDIELGLTVERQNGEVVFDKPFSGKGNSFCLLGQCAFNTAVTEAVTDVLNKIIHECSKEEFQAAIAADERLLRQDVTLPAEGI
jgi:hypothetical protein